MGNLVNILGPATSVQVPYPVAAIGDLHGHIDLLDGLLDRLDREAPGHTLVFVGDFVDRGPASKEVVERVSGLVAAGKAAAVMGNHDLAFVRAAGLDGKPPSAFWRERYRDLYDCGPTLTSYLGRRPSRRDFGADLDAVRETMPAAHREFLANLPWLVSTPPSADGGHLFLHSGLSRGLTLTAQQQVGALDRKAWMGWMAKDGAGFRVHDEYPPWLGADRSACADPLPLHLWCQVTGHEAVDEPAVVGGFAAIRIDTTGGSHAPLSAAVLAGPAAGVRFVSYPERPRPRGRFW